MRALVCTVALILALAAVVAAGRADAKIRPIPRPAKAAGAAAAASHSSAVAPLPRPAVHTRPVVVHARKAVVRRTRPAARTVVRRLRAPVRASTRRRARAVTTHRVQTRVLARSRGGRYVPPVRSHGGRRQPPVVPVVPQPTPLGFVATGELLPSYDDPWPSWVFSLLGVMAASEVFLVVRLARARSYA
jgi:hypothetical protein